jgi:predicted alpha-1,2-mannosidase
MIRSTLCMSLVTFLPLHAYTLQNLTQYVSPFCGTQNGGNTFPGAVVPFGMMQWSPDTPQGIQGGSEQGGYLYTDTQIVGFSFNHLSGIGGYYGGDCGFTPLLGGVTSSPATSSSNGYSANPSAYSHSNEIAQPGYYSVVFNNGIRTELTTSTRTGFGRFTYPSGSTASMLINAGSGASIINASININTSNNEITGWTTGFGFLGSGQNHTVYFDIIFDHSFASYGTWNGATMTSTSTSASGSKIGVYLSFNLPSGGAVLARSAISWVSVANAQANMAAENPTSSFNSAGFTAMQTAAGNNWNGYLNKIQITGGSTPDLTTFYTMMYHSLLGPGVVSDTNNQYIGFDGSIHTTSGFTKYEYFSGWDIYRNECQFIAMINPSVASDMASSLVQDATDSGAMPRWSIPSGDTGTMIGDSATPIIAGMYAFGATNFNTSAALTDMENAAVNYTTVAKNGVVERDANRDYLNLGYVPQNEIGGYGPVSMTLEYCSDDCALALFAQALGNTSDYTLAINRAQNWRNLFNSSTGYIQMRQSDATWTPGFVNDNSTYDNDDAYVEGNASQYVWMVPFNYSSLVAMMGGTQAASSRLNTFFTQLNAQGVSPYAYMGNEPSSETPYVYDFIGEPYQCSNIVREVMTQLYSSSPTGLPGNDDIGQTSSWYVWAAL